MTPWLVHEMRRRCLDVVCLDARHARAALKMQINKTDQNDAEGLAQIMRTGWYRPVHSSPSKPTVPARSWEPVAARRQDHAIVEPHPQIVVLDKAVRAIVKQSATCRLLMSVPGIGVLSVLAYVRRLRRSRWAARLMRKPVVDIAAPALRTRMLRRHSPTA